jgi:molybdopterin-containing oxidoreductase family membrane subunit
MASISARFRGALASFRITPFVVWVGVLGAILLVGVAAGLMVFIKGLSITNLNDLVPWGLWITMDLSSIALSAGAFLLCAAVYLLGLKQLQPVARTATFVGLIGYSMALLALIMDIGRPDRFWHSIVFWNTHSVMWEVTMCILLYFTVLILEAAPILGGAAWFRTRWPKLAGWLQTVHQLAPVLAIVGLCLSLLHQSSLGAAYGVLKARPIWYRPDMSVLFIASAIAAGPSLTVLVSMLAARLSRKVHVDDRLLEKVASFIGWVLVVYLYFRFWDAFAMTYTYAPGRTEGLQLLTRGPLAFNFWVVEIILGAVVPIFILLRPKLRARQVLRMVALALVVVGVIAYRWDTNMAGQLTVVTYLPSEIVTRYTTYVPSLVEILSGAGVAAYGALAITLGVRYLNVVDHRTREAESHVVAPASALPASD